MTARKGEGGAARLRTDTRSDIVSSDSGISYRERA